MFSKSAVRTITTVLLINFVVLAVLHFIAVAIDLYVHDFSLQNYTYLFDLDSEYNVPTIYSGVLLLSIGLTALGLMRKEKSASHKIFWVGLALFFIYWAIDEVFVLHERLAEPIREMLQIGYDSPLYHAWVLVALGLIGLLGLFMLLYRFIKKPPLTKEQGSLLVTLLVFMSGIVLLEILGTRVYGSPAVYRFVMTPMEELFEIGMASFILIKLLKCSET